MLLETKFFQKPLMVILGLVLTTVSTAQPSKAASFNYQAGWINCRERKSFLSRPLDSQVLGKRSRSGQR
ncbi:MAG: hypothetical protein V7L22_18475, partial [Nostoc sp.]|uniref:hypothetical protein n=1 Tax=Nostoc sp. TaxID=1180 RepID=UPI003B5D3A99